VGVLLLGTAVAAAQAPPPPSLNDILTGRLQPRTEEHKVSIGGEEVTVHLQPPSASTNRALKVNDDSVSGGFFDRLAPAARDGNDDAAHWLYYSLERCRYAPKSRAEFDAKIEQGRKNWAQTGGVVAPGDTPQTPQDLDQWVKDQGDALRRCDGVTDEMYETSKQLLRESVERGSDYNRAYYAQAIAKTDPEGAQQQYKILWDQGDVTGLKGLGTRSLPHRIAASIVMGMVYEAPEKSDEFLRKMQAAVSPSAYREASKEAAKILKNPNCCHLSNDW
jgi:hypothetical protein